MRNLQDHYEHLRYVPLGDLFAEDPARGERLTAQGPGIYLDYSKNRVTNETLNQLFALARECRLSDRIDAMFRGDRINVTENRPALHVAFRVPSDASSRSTAPTSSPRFTTSSIAWGPSPARFATGHGRTLSGRANRDQHRHRRQRPRARHGIRRAAPVPAIRPSAAGSCRTSMVPTSEALARLRARHDAVRDLLEDVHHHRDAHQRGSARTWLVDALGDEAVAKHFVAVSTNAEQVAAFGIDMANMFGFWDWVGGRYCYDSAIGLSLMVAIGPDAVRRDARRVPRHGRALSDRAVRANLPVLLGLLGVWYGDFVVRDPCRAPLRPRPRPVPELPPAARHGVNGKSVTLDGRPVQWDTGPIVWGQPGTNGQHAFYQLLHQGTTIVPADFLVAVHPEHPLDDTTTSWSRTASRRPRRWRSGRPPSRSRRKVWRRSSSPASHVRRQPAEHHDPVRPPHARRSAAWSRCTSTRSSPRARSGG